MSTLTHLPLDLNGNQATNHITAEEHTLVEVGRSNHRLILPRHGAFYDTDLRVYYGNFQMLQRGVDYKPVYLYQELSDLTGKAVLAAIVVLSDTVPDTVKIEYRAVGGMFSLSIDQLKDLLHQVENTNDSTDFDSIVGKPKEYIPLPHTQEWYTLYGLDRTKDMLDEIRDAIITGRTATYKHDTDYADHYYQVARTAFNVSVSEYEDHNTDFTNPHEDNKDDVDLGLVENLPLATAAIAREGTSHNHYLTPVTAYESLRFNAIVPRDNHMADRNNPHQDHIHQIDGYTRAEIDAKVASKHPRSRPVPDVDYLNGNDLADLINTARNSMTPASFVGTGSIDPARLGTGVADSNTVLLGDGRWVNYDTVFSPHAPKAVPTLVFVGQHGSAGAALNDINARFGNIEQYPSGSVAMFRLVSTFEYRGQNGATTYTMPYWDIAVRNPGGWVLA